MHDVGVMLAGENVTRAPHVGRQLIDFVEPAVDKVPHEVGIAKIAEHEIIGFRLAKAWKFEISRADPEAFALQPADKVMPDETTSSADQGLLSRSWYQRHVSKLRLSFS